MQCRGKWQTMAMVGLALASAWTGQARADFVFTKPVNLGPNVNSYDSEYDPAISADGLELYFQSARAGGFGGSDLYVATRATTQDTWGPAVNLGSVVNGSAGESGPCILPDGLTLYFNSNREGGSGNSDLYVTTRRSSYEPWDPPVNLGPVVNGKFNDINPCLSADGLTLYFADAEDGGDGGVVANAGPRPGGQGGTDIWVAQRASLSEPWGEPVNLRNVNSGSVDGAPEISADGLMLFFNSNRAGGLGQWDIWVSTRKTANDPWGTPVNLGMPVNSGGWDGNASLSADGRTLYFASTQGPSHGFSDIWQVSIDPLVDFNGDGKVDSEEVRIMLANWGTDEPLCDIGPTPFGDGVVDMKDMAVLTQYAAVEMTDPTLVACWTFDETEGDVACDSGTLCNGTLLGNPVWRPDGGVVGGAIQLDGVDDHVAAGYPTELGMKPMSVFAWVKGGKPGQAILSQRGGANWLIADPASGVLMTDLRSSGRLSRTLCSQAVIADGNWHRIGIVWDGATRSLFVDGTLAAQDTQENLPRNYKNLHIGTGKDLASGTFWSGLIDDVRIYDRVITP